MAAVAFDPVPLNPVRLGGVEQLLPQLGILDRLLVRRAPAVAAPAVDPLGDPVADVIAVRIERDPARLLEGLQRANRRDQLHSVVGRRRLATADLAFLVAYAQQRGPAARTGIPAARSVRINFDQRQL